MKKIIGAIKSTKQKLDHDFLAQFVIGCVEGMALSSCLIAAAVFGKAKFDEVRGA